MQWNSIFHDIKKIEFFEDQDITNYSTMRLKARANLLIAKDTQELKKLIPRLHQENVKYTILGWGANQLLSYHGKSHLYLKLQQPMDEKILKKKQSLYHLNASTSIAQLIKHALVFGNYGWEVLTGIPASLGGAIFMNAGTKFGEISQIIDAITLLKSNAEFEEIKIHDSNKLQYFGYRKNFFCAPGDIIVAATLTQAGFDDLKVPVQIKSYLEYRKKTQPLKSFNCGCVFKNPPQYSAGQIIDELGLKGMQYKELRISQVHANFIENLGEATLTDFLEFIEIIQEKVFIKLGHRLELEVKF